MRRIFQYASAQSSSRLGLDPSRTRALRCVSMPSQPLSLLDTRSLTANAILSLFSHADEIEATYEEHGCFFDPDRGEVPTPKIIACLFFEASTRTFMSFQTAALRLGHQVITLDTGTGSSILKGETEDDTVLNVAAMGPDALIVRYNRSPALDELLPQLPMPVISAGTGTSSHPTQGLLDAYTIHRERGSVRGEKVLIVGDVAHSRVARSDFDVLQKLGAEIGVCGPEHFLPPKDEFPGLTYFSNLDEALDWPTVFMGLRVQLERHDDPHLKSRSLDDYRSRYHGEFGLSVERLKTLHPKVTILHPGPINHGVEFAPEVLKDPRARVLEQVKNGVLIRAALLSKVLAGRIEN